MPQKRNPDIAELLRAKSGRLIGDVVTLLTVSKGLALAYNKDLQETQEPFYDAVETTALILAVLPRLIAGLEFNVERMSKNRRATRRFREVVDQTGVPIQSASYRREPHTPGCRRSRSWRKAIPSAPISRGAPGSRAVQDPMHAQSQPVREPGDPGVICGGGHHRTHREAQGQSTMMNDARTLGADSSDAPSSGWKNRRDETPNNPPS
jgi:hypothetical protein